MIKCMIGLAILIACFIIAAPIIMIAIPGILLVIAVMVFFRWLDKAAASDTDNHDDKPRR